MPTAISFLATLGRIDAGITSAITSVLSGVMRGLLGVFGVAIGGFVVALKSAVGALTAFASRVASISDQTGQGLSKSLALVDRFAALGISPDKTASIFGSREMAPQLFDARSRALGGPLQGDANFGVKLSTWFQGEAKKGLGGFLAARAKLDSLFGGNAAPEVLRLANSRPETLQREAAYGANLQSKLGINGDVIRRASEDLPLLQNRISLFISTVQPRFAAEMLPTLETVFGVVSELFINNAGNIAGVLRNVGRWMFVEMPGLALRGAQVVLDTGKGIADTFFMIGDAGVSLLQSLGSHEGALYNVLKFAANFIDFMSNFGRDFAIGLEYTRVQIGNALATWQDLSPVGRAVRASGLLDFQHEDPMAAAQAVFNAQGPVSTASAGLDKFLDPAKMAAMASNLAGKVAGGRANAASLYDPATAWIRDATAKYADTAKNQAAWQTEMLENTKGIRKSSEKTSLILDAKGNPFQTGEQVLGDIGARFAERAIRMNRRRG